MNPVMSGVPGPALDLIDELVLTSSTKETKAMLLYEDLARERMREAERVAREHHLVRRLSSAKRWERLSAWAARRAERILDRDLI
jgi:hypothetical protein